MSKVLIVAEKPSVARDIAAALGGLRQDARNVQVRADAIVTAAHGHLIEVGFHEEDDRKWELHQLPVVPPAPGCRMARRCPRCQHGQLLARSGARGRFFGCSNYPKCMHTKDTGA